MYTVGLIYTLIRPTSKWTKISDGWGVGLPYRKFILCKPNNYTDELMQPHS